MHFQNFARLKTSDIFCGPSKLSVVPGVRGQIEYVTDLVFFLCIRMSWRFHHLFLEISLYVRNLVLVIFCNMYSLLAIL